MAARHRFSSHSNQNNSGSSSWRQGVTQTITNSFTRLSGKGDLEDNSSDHEDILDAMNIASRDRTNEFHSVLKSIKSRQTNGTTPRPSAKQSIAQRTEFSRFAKHIGQDLSKTYEKLEKLTLLCKKRSLFDDRPVEIQELTYIIKQDINSLKRKIQQLEENKSQASAKRDAQKHTSSIVRTLRSKLANMSENFKSVLEVRRENMKQQKLRKDQFSSSNLSSSMPLSATQGHKGSVLLMDEQRSATNPSGSVAISMDGSSYSQNQTVQLVEQQDSYISERASTMETIESTIVELGNIFQQLATMVKEQEEQVMRIDSNVEESELNIEAAHSEVLKYFQGITSNRWLMIKIFLILIAFFVVFVVFFA
uniref:t-SNARE coiled-coil homology domain-containing protein n=1 Tax=Ciona savignyi TaxID=51511 RepID=H2Z1V9_CIOSA